MCVDDDSRPPIHPIGGGSAGSTDLRLASAVGKRFMAHAARATAPTGAGVVMISDVRGLHQYYKDLSDRFAEVLADGRGLTLSTEIRQCEWSIPSHDPCV
jgi:carboxymethylenebutenolidase